MFSYFPGNDVWNLCSAAASGTRASGPYPTTGSTSAGQTYHQLAGWIAETFGEITGPS